MVHSSLPVPQAIIFDFDNTLVDTAPIIEAAKRNTFAYMGYSPNPDELDRIGSQSMKEYFPTLFGDRWQEAATYYQQQYRAVHLEHLAIMPGAEETLLYLAASRLPVAVVSNKMHDTLVKEIQHLKWEGYFFAVVGAGNAIADKPSLHVVEKALEGSGISSGAHVWLIGDAIVDLECARNASCTGILYGSDSITPLIEAQFPAIPHVKNHQELLATLSFRIGCDEPFNSQTISR